MLKSDRIVVKNNTKSIITNKTLYELFHRYRKYKFIQHYSYSCISISQLLIIIFAYIIVQQFIANEKMYCFGLTSEERNELARKFKYYHNTVRPMERFNLIQTVNGTFFGLNTELEILQTKSDIDDDRKFYVELVLTIHYNDDRLILRDLIDIIHVPKEFQPWIPSIEFVDGFGSGGEKTISSSSRFLVDRTVHLDPKNGQLTIFHRITGSINCFTDAWKYPFERFKCEVEFLTEQNEYLLIRVIRDLRINPQRYRVSYSIKEWPNLISCFEFSRQWLFAIINIYLPSALIFSAAFLAQCKRRKMQVLVTISSIICIVIIKIFCKFSPYGLSNYVFLCCFFFIILFKFGQDRKKIAYYKETQNAQRYGSSPSGNQLYRHHSQNNSALTMQDIWLNGLLIHLICLLTIDLLLPSRRIVYKVNPITGKLKPKLLPTDSQSPLYFSKKRTALPYISPRYQLSLLSMFAKKKFSPKHVSNQFKKPKLTEKRCLPYYLQQSSLNADLNANNQLLNERSSNNNKQVRFGEHTNYENSHLRNCLQNWNLNERSCYDIETSMTRISPTSVLTTQQQPHEFTTTEIWTKYENRSVGSDNRDYQPYPSNSTSSNDTPPNFHITQQPIWQSDNQKESTEMRDHSFAPTYEVQRPMGRSVSTLLLQNISDSGDGSISSPQHSLSPHYACVQSTNNTRFIRFPSSIPLVCKNRQFSQQNNKFHYESASKLSTELTSTKPTKLPSVPLLIRQFERNQIDADAVTSSKSTSLDATQPKIVVNDCIKSNNYGEDEECFTDSDHQPSPPSTFASDQRTSYVTIGEKKRIALTAVLISFITFTCFYVLLALYAIQA